MAGLDDIDLTDLDRFANGFPHELFTRLRHERPVWFHAPTVHTPGGEGFWVLTRHADITAVANHAAAFSSHTGGGRAGGGTLIEDLPSGFAAGVLLNMMDDPRHRHIRRLAAPALSPRTLHELEDELRARTAAILDDVLARGRCDFLVDVAAELPLQAIAKLLGVPQADRHQLFGWANATLDYDDRDLGAQSDKAAAAGAAMFEYGGRLLAEKRRAPAADMLSAIAHGTVPGEGGSPAVMTELEQQMFFNLLVFAGSETTRNSIAVGVLALIERPAQWTRLQRERALLPSAVEEMLRWASSTPYNRRTATRDRTIGDAAIKAGDKLTLWWASANRDEALFAEPFRFDIARTPNPHLAFGIGSHFCLGATLARLEIRVVLDALLDRCAGIALDGPLEWTRSNKHSGVRHMPVRLTAR